MPTETSNYHDVIKDFGWLRAGVPSPNFMIQSSRSYFQRDTHGDEQTLAQRVASIAIEDKEESEDDSDDEL